MPRRNSNSTGSKCNKIKRYIWSVYALINWLLFSVSCFCIYCFSHISSHLNWQILCSNEAPTVGLRQCTHESFLIELAYKLIFLRIRSLQGKSFFINYLISHHNLNEASILIKSMPLKYKFLSESWQQRKDVDVVILFKDLVKCLKVFLGQIWIFCIFNRYGVLSKICS